MQKGGPDVNDMSASVFLVSHILFELHAKRRGTNSFAIDLDDFAHAITILQLAIEREIVTRVIRVNDGNNDSGFLAAMKTIKCTSE